MAANAEGDMPTIMLGTSRVLPVPYLAQPTDTTCQATVLKMMAMYLERVSPSSSSNAASLDIPAIKTEINSGQGRPSTKENAHENFKWWLQRRFPKLKFELSWVYEEVAVRKLVDYINSGSPVLMAVSHARVPGHIMLAIGYENYVAGVSSEDFHVIMHDPYGAFHPALLSKNYGKDRFVGGMSLASGGEIGPGQSCRLPITAASRQRKGDSALGLFTLLAARL